MGNTGLGTSLMIIAAGAILAFAVDYEATGIDIQTIGWVLMVVGIIGLLVSWLFLSSFSPLERRGPATTYVVERHPETAPPPSHTEVNVNPPPAEPPSRTEVNVNQPPPRSDH